MSAPTVLVTGASGMLGGAVERAAGPRRHRARAFQRRPADIDGVQDVTGSLTDAGDVRRAVKGADAVIHLAAKVSISGPEHEYRAINIEGTRHVCVDAVRRAGAPWSTSPRRRSPIWAGRSSAPTPPPPIPRQARGPYSRTKAAAELLAMAADGVDGLQVTSIRPHVVWGPGDTQLVGRIVDRARRGRLPLLDHGMALIDTTYVTNAADAIVAGFDRIEDVHGESFVVSNGDYRTVRDVFAGWCGATAACRPRACGSPAPLPASPVA